jgi:hypothetical protein
MLIAEECGLLEMVDVEERGGSGDWEDWLESGRLKFGVVGRTARLAVEVDSGVKSATVLVASGENSRQSSSETSCSVSPTSSTDSELATVGAAFDTTVGSSIVSSLGRKCGETVALR